jgi:TusA-related sulfurtransferase
MTEVQLDCRGQLCPLPVIALARTMPDVAVGDVVAVVSDDPAAAVDVPAWCRMKGQEYAGADAADDGTPRYLVRRIT